MVSVKFYVLTVVLLCSVKQAVGNFKAYFPPTNESVYPRLVFGALPTLNEFTFCSWIRLFNLTKTVPHIISYATNRTDDELALFFYTMENTILTAVQVINTYISFNCSFVDWNEMNWHHICATWLGINGKTRYFMDGKMCPYYGDPRPVSAGKYILGGGVAILGQEQGDVGSKFDVHEAWHGELTGVNLWSEILSEDQIQEAGKCHGKIHEGTVIQWSKTPMAAFNGVVIRKAELCE